jgi:hypothetical protein
MRTVPCRVAHGARACPLKMVHGRFWPPSLMAVEVQSSRNILWSGPDVFVGQPACVASSRGWLVAGRLLKRPGPTVHPMAWVDTRATPKQPAFSGCSGLAVRGRGPSVGHGYKNVKGQGTVTTPCHPSLLRLSGLVEVGSDQRDGPADRDDASPVVGPAIGAVNVFLRI